MKNKIRKKDLTLKIYISNNINMLMGGVKIDISIKSIRIYLIRGVNMIFTTFLF